MQVNKLHLNCGTEGGYPGGIQRVKSTYLLKIKAWEKNNQSLHSGKDKGIPSSCP